MSRANWLSLLTNRPRSFEDTRPRRHPVRLGAVRDWLLEDRNMAPLVSQGEAQWYKSFLFSPVLQQSIIPD
jgi:hypothetical protein